MITYLILLFVGLAVMVKATNDGVVGFGRVITTPMREAILRNALKKPNKKLAEKKQVEWKDIRRLVFISQFVARAWTFRYVQIMFMLALFTPLAFFVDNVFNIYWIIYIALFADDLLTGDINKWKKRWQSLKNKVRWQKFQPSPIRVPSA